MKKGFLGILALTLIFGMAVIGCDDGDGVFTSSTNESIVGSWIKTIDSSTANLTINSNNTLLLIFNSTLLANGTWDANEMIFINASDPSNTLTVTYSLSQDGDQLILNGENINLIGGNSPWTRDE